jgi:putative SOS response-associated peptidase YedK
VNPGAGRRSPAFRKAERDWPKWLGEEPASEDELFALLNPCPDDALKIWPVGKAVGNVKNTGPQLAMPILGLG